MNQEQTIRSLYEAMNSRDLDKFTSFFSDDGQFRDVSSDHVYRGKTEIRTMAESWLRAFPDMKLQVKNVIGNDDSVGVEMDLIGTHKGPLEGPMGTIPASNKRVNVPTCDVIQLRNGRIQSLSCYFAATRLLSQIGAIPSQRAA